MIKQTYESLLDPLCHVLNLSITKGVFPKELKIAKVIPLHKGDCKNTISYYKPVSLLPLFSKILEILMYNRLISFERFRRKKPFNLSRSYNSIG